MPTPTTKDAKQALYAVAGVADLAVSTIRHLPADAARLRDRLPGEAVKTYGDLVRRGESLVTGARRSRPTRQAAETTGSAAAPRPPARRRSRPAPAPAGPPPPTPGRSRTRPPRSARTNNTTKRR